MSEGSIVSGPPLLIRGDRHTVALERGRALRSAP